MITDPDGFVGTLLAIEGIADARAVLNGPNGCRGYPAWFSDRHYPRENSLDRRTFEELFYFGQPRIPCTYLDSDDYILGATGKLREILPLVAAKGDTLLAVVNSPGASLIGDDLDRFLVEAGLSHVCMAIPGAAYSHPLPEGFDNAMVAVLRWLKLNRLPRLTDRVNLLGISMIQKYWQGNIHELTHLLSLMGLTVVAAPGAGSGVAGLRESVTASVNIVVFPEYAQKTAEFYEKEFGIPAIRSPDGAPVGFAATESWIRAVAAATGRDPAPALAEIRRQRTHACHQIARHHHEGGYPKGSSFAVYGDSSLVLPLTTWLYEYLGMIPVSVRCMAGGDSNVAGRIAGFLAEDAFSGVLDADPVIAKPDFYFGSEIDGMDLALAGSCREIVGLYNRTSGEPEFVEQATLGGTGALWILERIFSAVKRFPE
ncbi:nitrogenase component 1 [Methanoregula sp.]|uniref:nitrogenase component 1 n=1 Tax=Methanoregula sp. TaxID=2052170 RepID=UPI002615A677|nr:nitrogenase component 1 [Methanoregula sp.]MDD5144190.1 nitrogenase component 1 [Methanoregula sp.]